MVNTIIQIPISQDVLAALRATAEANHIEIEEYVERLILQRIEEDALIDEIYEYEVAQKGHETQQTIF